MAKLPFAYVEHYRSWPFDIIHSDIWAPSPELSNLGFRYFIIFIDDFSCFTWLFHLKNKSDVFSVFKILKHLLIDF